MSTINVGSRVRAIWEEDWYLGVVCAVPAKGRTNYLVLFDGENDMEACDVVELVGSRARPAESKSSEDWDDLIDLKGSFSGTPQCCGKLPRLPKVKPRGSGMMSLFDSHCHAGALQDSLPRVARIKARMIICGTQESDWPLVQHACTTARHAVPAFGLHPWFSHCPEEGWLGRLRWLLERTPRAIVGEIGLDKVYRTKDTRKCEYQAQQLVFKAQLQLAHELSRPVSVHCVQSWGKVLECLQECAENGKLPPAIALHSWGGPPEWISQFKKAVGPSYPLYFGFSEAINHKAGDLSRLERLRGNLEAVHEDSMLLESDLDNPEYIDQHMGTICNVVAKLKSSSFQDVAIKTAENTVRFLSAGEGLQNATSCLNAFTTTVTPAYHQEVFVPDPDAGSDSDTFCLVCEGSGILLSDPCPLCR